MKTNAPFTLPSQVSGNEPQQTEGDPMSLKEWAPGKRFDTE